MRILITGGCGFIGHHLVNFALQQPNVSLVVVFDCMDVVAETKYFEPSDKFVLVRGDLRCFELVQQTLQTYNITHMMHLAAQSHVDTSFAKPLETIRCNVESTLTLLQAIVAVDKTIRILLMSTDEVYGDAVLQNRTQGCDEHADFEPTNPYSASKASAEMIADVYSKIAKLDIVVPRCNNVFGPGQQFDKLIPRFIQQAQANEKFTLHGRGDQRRVWIYVQDVVNALWVLLNNGVSGQRYNIGTDQVLSVKQVANAIYKHIHGVDASEDQFIHVPDRPHNDQLYWICYQKLKWSLGWDFETTFQAGIMKTIQQSLEPTVGKCPRFKLLLFGAKGWLSSQFLEFASSQPDFEIVAATTRPGVSSDQAVFQEIISHAPTHVLAILGRTHGWGHNTIDCFVSLEARESNYRDNVTAPLTLASLCRKAFVHFTYIGTGCIFQYDAHHPVPDPTCQETRYCVSDTLDESDATGFTESDRGNFKGSDYVLAKTIVDNMMHTEFNQSALNCRIRMPISAKWHPRNLLFKLHEYEKIVDIPNSVTVFPQAFDFLFILMRNRTVGTVNLVHPGGLRHQQILDILYTHRPFLRKTKTIVQSNSQKTLQDRSNCILNSSKLRSLIPFPIPSAKEAVELVVQQMQ